MIVVQQPEGMADLSENHLHGLQSEDYWDDASSTASSGSSGTGSSHLLSSNHCQRFFVNLRLEVNERMLSSSEDEVTNGGLVGTSWQRQRMRRKRRRGKFFSVLIILT